MKNFKAGKYVSQGHYESFEPSLLHREWQLDDLKVIELLSKADRQLGRLDMYSEYIPNIDLFISMHVTKEATQSSKIEGTQTHIEEALMDKENVPAEKRDDWEEVQNYIAAMSSAIHELEKLPFSSRLIRNTHSVLMQGVRGETKQPGEFRKSQNWIGGGTVSEAMFVPPIHENIPKLMGDLENFMHDENLHLPDLIKIGIMHYQFETIHPFLDGNGRVGRLMITLFLVSCGILKQPILYLSDYFEKNRTDYYDYLMRVRLKDDLSAWIQFFLKGVIETAKSSSQTFDGILKLQKDVDKVLQAMGARSANAQKVVNHLYKRPLISADRASEVAEVSMPTAYKLINSLEEHGILYEVTGAERNRLYIFKEYLDLFKS
ncbi:Fic family protein [Rhodohalobacter sp.]|uniref:Fic family protein n=1 Tax=Rhodohalobacter sp. TaxID=1974210 RepID=UPI002ACDB423|nr:Fic family protein [Rhodohalobacter sp.]MDZ7758251.1 Fic family protein [Rhodohalobacter sp.]